MASVTSTLFTLGGVLHLFQVLVPMIGCGITILCANTTMNEGIARFVFIFTLSYIAIGAIDIAIAVMNHQYLYFIVFVCLEFI